MMENEDVKVIDVIGERTCGKWIAQSRIPLDGKGCYYAFTKYNMYTPTGKRYQDEGLMPTKFVQGGAQQLMAAMKAAGMEGFEMEAFHHRIFVNGEATRGFVLSGIYREFHSNQDLQLLLMEQPQILHTMINEGEPPNSEMELEVFHHDKIDLSQTVVDSSSAKSMTLQPLIPVTGLPGSSTSCITSATVVKKDSHCTYKGLPIDGGISPSSLLPHVNARSLLAYGVAGVTLSVCAWGIHRAICFFKNPKKNGNYLGTP